MQDHDTPMPGERYAMLEREVLYMMTGDEQPIWSVEDLGRDLDDPTGVQDAVHGLRTAGLIHQTSDGFVFATRAGCRIVEIIGKVA